jgi:hypothetical protein
MWLLPGVSTLFVVGVVKKGPPKEYLIAAPDWAEAH